MNGAKESLVRPNSYSQILMELKRAPWREKALPKMNGPKNSLMKPNGSSPTLIESKRAFWGQTPFAQNEWCQQDAHLPSTHQDPDIRGECVLGKPCECWNRECGGIVSIGNGGIGSGDFPTREKSRKNPGKCCGNRQKSANVWVKSTCVHCV